MEQQVGAGTKLVDVTGEEWVVLKEHFINLSLTPTTSDDLREEITNMRFFVALDSMHGRLQRAEDRRSENQRHYFGGQFRNKLSAQQLGLSVYDEDDEYLFKFLNDFGVTTKREYDAGKYPSCTRNTTKGYHIYRQGDEGRLQRDIQDNGTAYGRFLWNSSMASTIETPNTLFGPTSALSSLMCIEASSSTLNYHPAMILGFGECMSIYDNSKKLHYWIIQNIIKPGATRIGRITYDQLFYAYGVLVM